MLPFAGRPNTENVCLVMYAPICWGHSLGKRMFADVCSHLLGPFIKENVIEFVLKTQWLGA